MNRYYEELMKQTLSESDFIECKLLIEQDQLKLEEEYSEFLVGSDSDIKDRLTNIVKICNLWDELNNENEDISTPSYVEDIAYCLRTYLENKGYYNNN